MKNREIYIIARTFCCSTNPEVSSEGLSRSFLICSPTSNTIWKQYTRLVHGIQRSIPRLKYGDATCDCALRATMSSSRCPVTSTNRCLQQILLFKKRCLEVHRDYPLLADLAAASSVLFSFPSKHHSCLSRRPPNSNSMFWGYLSTYIAPLMAAMVGKSNLYRAIIKSTIECSEFSRFPVPWSLEYSQCFS